MVASKRPPGFWFFQLQWAPKLHCYLSALKSWHNNLFPSSVNTGGQYGIITHIGHTISWPRRENEQYKFSSRTAWRVSSASRTTDAQLSLFSSKLGLGRQIEQVHFGAFWVFPVNYQHVFWYCESLIHVFHQSIIISTKN